MAVVDPDATVNPVADVLLDVVEDGDNSNSADNAAAPPCEAASAVSSMSNKQEC